MFNRPEKSPPKGPTTLRIFHNTHKKIATLKNAPFEDWFKNSLVTEPNSLHPQITYHGTIYPLRRFKPYSHFATKRAAESGVFLARKNADFTALFPSSYKNYQRTFGKNSSEYEKLKQTGTTAGHIFPVFLRITRPLDCHDPGDYHRLEVLADLTESIFSPPTQWKIRSLIAKGCERQCEYLIRSKLLKAGYDGFRYVLKYEDPGSIAWIPLSNLQIRSVFNPHAPFYGNHQHSTMGR